MGNEERKELSLEEAASLLGLSRAGLLELLLEAGLRAKEGSQVRLRAAEVLALQREREKRLSRSMEELNRLKGEADEDD